MTSELVTTWLSEHRIDGEIVARIGRRGPDLVAEFPQVGTLVAGKSARTARFEAADGAPRAAVEKLNSTLLEALARHLRGELTLHGGCVSLGSRAVAFLGPSAAGKSTLAAALCSEAEVRLVADDTIAIEQSEEGVVALPTQTVAWLLPSARHALGIHGNEGSKVAVPLRSATGEKVSLVAILGLVFDPDAAQPTMDPIRGRDAFALLARSAIRLVVDEPAAQLREFDQLRSLVQRCPVFELRRRRDFGAFARCVDLVRGLFGERPR